MLSYIYYILGYNYDDTNLINDEDIYIDKELITIKNNLKKVKSLKKQFYIPTVTELNNQINKIKNKNQITCNNKLIITEQDLINSKNRLRKCRRENIIRKTFSDQLKLAKLNLKKTNIEYKIENFCSDYLKKFEQKNKKNKKYKNYVIEL